MDQNSPSLQVYNTLLSRDFEPELLNDRGQETQNPQDAAIINFDFKTPNKNYGTVVLLFNDSQGLEIYYGDNVGRSMEGDDKKVWYDFLDQMRMLAKRNLLTFDLKNLNRLKFTIKGMAAIKEGLFEGYYGTRKMSYSDQPKQVKLVIKHNKTLGEGDARFRYIESLFVETADGERFKVPTRSLTHGKMLARHCSEGGTPYDAFGQHINDMISEMHTLSKFLRAAKNRSFGPDGQAMIETAVRHYAGLKAKAKRMIGRRGYREEIQNFDPSEFTDSEVAVEAIRDMFVEQSIDNRIEEALPILAKLSEDPAAQFEQWTDRVVEGIWAIPETPEQIKKLKDLMLQPLEVGPDATNATEQLYDIFGDDRLFDQLGDLSTADPEADARPVIQKRLAELGMADILDIAQPTTPPDSNVQETVEDPLHQKLVAEVQRIIKLSK